MTRASPVKDPLRKLPFSFAGYAEDFDRHIERSIRGYRDLMEDCAELATYFVEDGTTVLDLGCSTGRLLAAIRAGNQNRAPGASYVGLDIETGFQEHWKLHPAGNMRFAVQDVVDYRDFANLSLVTSIFTLQFLPERQRRDICRRIFDGLLPGGALIIAEKTFAKSPKIQDMLTSLHLQYKRRHFSDEEIMDKEKSLRDMLKPGRESDLLRLLADAGFKAENVESFWRSYLFAAYVCVKQ